MGRLKDLFAAALKKATAEGDANPVLGHVAPGLPELPLVNELFADQFYADDCPPLLRCVLSKHLGDRSIEEHIVFSGYVMGLLEASLRGDFDTQAEPSQQPKARAAAPSKRATRRRRKSKR